MSIELRINTHLKMKINHILGVINWFSQREKRKENIYIILLSHDFVYGLVLFFV